MLQQQQLLIRVGTLDAKLGGMIIMIYRLIEASIVCIAVMIPLGLIVDLVIGLTVIIATMDVTVVVVAVVAVVVHLVVVAMFLVTISLAVN
jgi:hypothetical protein